MSSRRTYQDDALAKAIATSHSWRAVLRALGLAGSSASVIRSVRQNADRLGIDHSHFTGQRRWSDGQLAAAVAVSRSWGEVAGRLGLTGGSSEPTLKRHAQRLGLQAEHLESKVTAGPPDSGWPAASAAHLPRAGSLLAASWFTLRGCEVAWPLEPCRYDLLVSRSGAPPSRIQVKTTQVRVGNTWKVYLSNTGRGRRPYDPREIDFFFVIDGDLDCYLLPVDAVAGLHAIHLAAYCAYRLERLTPTRPERVGARERHAEMGI